MIRRIYIAGPYSATTRKGRKANRDRAVLVGRKVVKCGHYPVIPHVIGFELEDLNDDWNWWMNVTSRELSTCDAMVLVPGYRNSKGAMSELGQCQRDGIPCFLASQIGLEYFQAWADSEMRKKETVM